MRVIFVTKGGYQPKGGAQKVAIKWYKQLTPRIECHLLTDQDPSGRELENSHIFRTVPLSYLRDVTWFSTTLAKMCRKLEPDLIHLHSHTGFIVFPPKNIPMVVTFHDEPAFIPHDTVSLGLSPLVLYTLAYSEQLLRRLMLKRNPWVHALSSTIKNQLINRGIEPHRITVIPNGFSMKVIPPQKCTRSQLLSKLGLKEDVRIVVSIGNLAFRKGFHRILSVAAALRDSHSEIHFLIIGSSNRLLERSYALALQRMIKSLNLENVHLLGFIRTEMLQDIMSHADLYLSTALSEACNLALMEAATYGLPIIATSVGAARDLFEGEATLLETTASDNTIAKAIVKILTFNIRRKKYTSVKQYSWTQVTDRLISFYHELLSDSR